MTTVKNETNTSNEATIRASKSVFAHGSASNMMASSAKTILEGLNEHAVGLTLRELGTREATYRYVAALVDAARDFAEGKEFMTACTRLFEGLFGRKACDEALVKGSNPYNFLVRAADGEWESVTDSKGKTSWKWNWNRSGEKYAAEPRRVCRRLFGLSYAAMAGSSSMA